MRKSVWSVLAVAAALVATPARAQSLGMLVTLNGSAKRLGVMTSTGSNVTMTVTAGTPLLVQCDAAAHVGAQATCSASYTSTNFCPKQAADERNYFIASGATLAMIPATGTVNCVVFQMQ